MTTHDILMILLVLSVYVILPITIWFIIKKIKKSKEQKYNLEQQQWIEEQKLKYTKKALMTKCEKYFYNIINENLPNNYIIFPQINLASIIEKHKDYPTQYQNELFRNIDFGIFDKKTMEIKLLIEINDITHNEQQRIIRDIKVSNICEMAGIKLITFYTDIENTKETIMDKIINNLK